MKTLRPKNQIRALTVIEVLVILAIIAILAALLLPPLAGAKAKHLKIQCVNNLKQIGLSYHIWSGDHGDSYPMRLSETNGGTMEFISGPNAYRHFQIMSNELSTPKVLFCPNESDSFRSVGTNFNIGNPNISFFVGIDADQTKPAVFLSGDHNLTNGTPITNSLLNLTTNHPVGWTRDVHVQYGNIGFADGSVQRVTTPMLQTFIANSGVATNRLQMP